MKVLIVDDEGLALARLKRVLNDNNIFDIAEFSEPLEAIKEISKTKFDAVFLDISMPNFSGLELAELILNIEPKTFIVFQTAYEEYALDAFKKGGMGYLLKPVEDIELKNILKKIFLYKDEKVNSSKKILGKVSDKIYLVEIDDIFYIKADLDEIIIRTKDNFVYAKKKIGDLEEILKDKNFFRVHRSYIVNVDKIKSIKSVEQSKLEIYFSGIDEFIVSSKDGAKEFREYLDKKSI
ncbi:LytR/AlgR family response regulator transcription factor [Aliarcobacter skirrowii]|uniref:DNA-binding response regulator n=1 Tax=Aliarcobacter skirrowii TaxID=28200 RepID=A0A2U2C372_9BACT|nr:LytTR family DNA-binding domain-containing protein [Aliarcobacter skirrowii]PWE22624.1 DNA-binding response regulator [Aliarcobacter skirrowii]PWE23499.1 DNA-binding response regulator [Aliarcobacter skirrowii]PWE25459.1 DNA-binding response regulator [Aliarcobacter skirrowii]RJO56727.1 DNA-binding response regulator [Aliarcobacter skirrowii]RJO58681.1 DNA-binding response regulator [Aliarcobacter skirrowii]